MAGNVEEDVADAYAAYPSGTFVRDHFATIHGSYRDQAAVADAWERHLDRIALIALPRTHRGYLSSFSRPPRTPC
jgi:hypothetical protein